jgi:hypothetical protein
METAERIKILLVYGYCLHFMNTSGYKSVLQNHQPGKICP